MNLDFFKLKSIYLENTVVRNPKVGSKNRPTSRTIDVGCTGVGSMDNIYTGETGINSEYLIQGSVAGNVIKGTAGTFTLNDKKIQNIEDISGLLSGETIKWGDILRADGYNEFYNITGASDDLKTIWLQDNNTTVTGINNFQIRKTKINSTHFEYIKSDGDDKFFYDQNNREWRYTGMGGFTGPLLAESNQKLYIEKDSVIFKFYPSNAAVAPDITSVDTTTTDTKSPYGKKILENKLVADTSDIILNPIPYPDDDENFRIYWGPQSSVSLKRKDVDYTINYTMDPDYTSAKLPYKDRTAAYIKFLNELTDTVQIEEIGLDFQGIFNIHEDPSTSATKQPRGVTNIFPNSNGLKVTGDDTEYRGEIIRVGDTVLGKYFDYNIEYDNGIVNFIRHANLELAVPNVLYNRNLIWDGVSVIRGVGLTGLKSQDPDDLVIPYGIAGLTGINVPVYFEDVDENVLKKDQDYVFEYQSGAIKLNTPLKSEECVLVSYFVEGEDVIGEKVNLVTMRTRKYPVIESSVTLKKKYSDKSTTSTGIKILVEGVDFRMLYLSGTIEILNQSIKENLDSLEINYTPFAQLQCILQPVADDPNRYRVTIIDDKLTVVDPFNLKFNVKNPLISIPQKDPFGEEPITYDNSIAPGSVLSVKGKGEPGYGLGNLTPEQMIDIGITGLHFMGLDRKLGKTTEEFYALGITGIIELGIEQDTTQIYDVTNYKYYDESKELALDASYNVDKPKPDLNDLILATYSYVDDVLPYAPVQTIFPVFNKDENSILIEGFDRTDIVYPGMIFRIDNYDPQKYYYFKVNSVVYDGLNTTIYLTGSFVDDIRNPSFYLFDDIINWHPLPEGTSIDSSATIGTDTFTLIGGTLETKALLRPQALMMVDGIDIYEILSTSVVDSNTIQVKIFPNLQRAYPETILISDPIYQEGTSDIQSKYPIIIDPPHPAFTIRYIKPNSAIYGLATIYINGEKIVITEVIDDASSIFNYYIKDYNSLRDLADAIKDTVSNLGSTTHNPFSLMSEDGAVEQYYVGFGFWSANLVLPFEQDAPIIIPNEGYTITIKQEVFRYILIKAYKDTFNFLIEQKNRLDYFLSGNLLAFRSKATGNLSFFEISNVDLINEFVSGSDPIVHTRVTFKDAFRENMIAPYMYKYDSVNWVEIVTPSVAINHNESKISFYTDLTILKIGSVIKINNSFIYQIKDISVNGTITTLTVSPSIKDSLNQITSLYVSDMPIYIDAVSPQPSIFINYSIHEGYSGEAYVEIDNKNIKITEKIIGFSEYSAEISLTHYDNLNQLADAINRLQLTIPGYNPLFVDTTSYKDLFIASGRSLKLVPTSQKTYLSTSILVSKSIFKINYTSPDSSTDYKVVISSDGSQRIELSEWKRSDKPGTLKINYVNYQNRTIIDVINDILNLDSIVYGKPWSVGDINYDVYYATNKVVYYSIIPYLGEEGDSLPYCVQVTETPQYWCPVGVLNRNVLIEGTDYNIEGTQVILTNPIKISERYELSYLGIDDLAEYEGENIKCSCRYFYSIPAGYQICAYMDYLNPDQYYIQKLTERRFLEIVTLPQIKDILQQSGGSVGMGNDNGSDNSANNWDGGLVDLYYYLKDEQIKSQIYLRLFSWYKHRLRNFAAEAQIIMGIKYGHCNYLGIKEDGRFTLEDAYVEDNNYTLTRLSDIDQIKNGFSKFFPIGYEDSAPKPYDRFKDQYQSYNEVFCYNIQYIGDDNKPIKKEGRILSSNPYWADALDSSTIFMDNGVTGIFSCLDFDILPYNQESAFIDSGVTGLLYNIPYNQEDKHLRVTDKNFKFLRRVSVGDELQIQDSNNSYKIAKIENRNLLQSPVIIRYSNASTGTPLTYDGTSEEPGKLPVYGIYLENYDYVLGTETYNPSEYPVGTPVIKVAGETGTIIGLGYKIANPDISYDRFILEDGKYFLDSGIHTFDVKKSGNDWKYVTKKISWTLQDLEDNLPKEGLNILIKRNENNDFPVIFPAWDDEFNLGTKVTGLRIINQKTNTDIIKKTFSFSELLGLDDEDKYFTVYIGSYDELTGAYKINSTTQVNLKYLNFFEERRVSRVLESLKYNITGNTYKLPFPPFILKVANTYKKKDNLGFDKFFYLDFDRYYEASAKNGYNESIIFRSRDRNSWVQYGVDQDNDFIAPEYGFSEGSVYNNFYDPNNLYLKLLVERQSWLTELNIIKDIFDTNNKLNRAFTYDVNGLIEDEAEFHDYLNQISCVTGRSLSIKERIELYLEHFRFLLDESDTTHKYLIENTSGPLYRTMMEYEDDINADTPINTSYKQAAAAKQKYEIFQWECNFYYNLNNFYYSKWSSKYAKWVLSLEKGIIFQKDAKVSFEKTANSYINVGLKTFPAIKISVIDQGTTPSFTVSGAKYVVAYNMLATTENEQEEYDDAVLYIEYKISNVVEIQNKSFILKDYPTLQNLVDAINGICKHPISGIQILSSACVFEFYPYRDYSTKWILRTYRNTINNDSNGSDILTNANGWTNLSTNPAIDDRIYVSNVIDHRNYDSRILFMNRIDIHSDKITIDKEDIISFPYYVANTGKEILGEIGPIPISGRWAEDAVSSTEAVDYTREFNVLDVRPGVGNATIVYYEFLDYVRGEEQIPGKETPRNPIYEKSPEQLISMGYNPETQILSEDEPPAQIELGTELVLDAKFKELQDLSDNINKSKGPQTSVIRDLRIILRIRNQKNTENYQDVSFVFDLRQYPTINDLNKAFNTNRYYSDSSGNIVLDDRDNAKIAPIGEGAVYFNSELIGSEDLQGVMKTVDIATAYTQQLIHVATHRYWSINPVEEYDISSGKIIVNINAKEIPEPIDEYYSVGWQLKEQGVINGKQIIFRIDPRNYSPGYNFRFKPYDPKNARIATFLNEKIDILAFDIYSWDTNAAYKIKDNILYLRSDSLSSVIQIPLYKTTNLDNSIDHPEEKLKLIDVIRLINNNGVCNKKFFANLRFGREYSYDFEYTYFPDTAIWAGGDGWIPVEKVVRDSMYLSKDIAFSLNSEGANATYEVMPPLPLFPDENTIYTSTSLILRADTIAFDIALNTTDYDIISAEYIVDQTAETMTLTGSYRTFTDVSQDFSFSSYTTMQDLVDAINAYLDPNQVFSASLYSPSIATVPTNKLINGTNTSLSSTRRLIASDTGLLQDSYPVINITPNNPEYEGIDYYVDIGLNKITLNYRHIVINPAIYVVDFNVDSTLFQVVSSINSYEPVSGNPFFNATVKWIDPGDLSFSLLDTPVTSIPFSGISVFMQGELEYSLLIGSNSITIEDLVNDINAQTLFTGFSVVGLDLPAYKGYKGLPANLLVPKAESSFSEPLYFDFRNIIGVYILNMSHTTRSLTSQMAPAGEPATCTISNGIISFEKVTGSSSYFIGNAYSYNIIDKDIGKLFRDSMDIEGYLEKQSSEYPNLSYATGILKMDVALLPIEGITYGKLRLRSKSETDPTLVSEVSSIDLVVNDPEVLNVHVYFGFLGDIRFYQISDYNLWKQYILIKRRLGLPWNKVNDVFIPDYYVPNDKYNFSSYEYTLNLVKNGKFLSYLKYQRFGELADSLRFEDLYNNKYLWLYLKFHKELGCDQKVKVITKKIAEDNQKAKLLM